MSIVTGLVFILNAFVPAYVQGQGAIELTLAPKPSLAQVQSLPMLRGIKVHSASPLKLEFVLDKGAMAPGSPKGLEGASLKEESEKLIKYFLASLTIPEKDLWVNLSPYEKSRIIPDTFGQTAMGRDLLAQDYILKQITASMMNPEGEVGKEFWKKIYIEVAKQQKGTGPFNAVGGLSPSISISTFNKVWIMPEKAVVYENAKTGAAYVAQASLKVLTEEDYVAVNKNQRQPGDMTLVVSPSRLPSKKALNVRATQVNNGTPNGEAAHIIRELIIPELTKEVNEGASFAQLRQVYHALILANWYKHKIKDSILNQAYSNKNKIKGTEYTNSIQSLLPTRGHDFSRVPKSFAKQESVESENTPGKSPNDVELIYQRYLTAFKKGAYNFIKEDQDPITKQIIPRKYFSGGATLMDAAQVTDYQQVSPEQLAGLRPDGAMMIVKASLKEESDQAMSTEAAWKMRAFEQTNFDVSIRQLFRVERKDINAPLDVNEDFLNNLITRIEDALDHEQVHNMVFSRFLEMYLTSAQLPQLRQVKDGFSGLDLIVFLQRLHTLSALMTVEQIEGKRIPIKDILAYEIIEDVLVYAVLKKAQWMNDEDTIKPNSRLADEIGAGGHEQARELYKTAHGIMKLNLLAGLHPEGIVPYVSRKISRSLAERDLSGSFALSDINLSNLVTDVTGRINSEFLRQASRANNQPDVQQAKPADPVKVEQKLEPEPAAAAVEIPDHVEPQVQESQGGVPIEGQESVGEVTHETAQEEEAHGNLILNTKERVAVESQLQEIIVNLAKENTGLPKDWSGQHWGTFRSAFLQRLTEQGIHTSQMFIQAIGWYITREQIKTYVGHYNSLDVQDLVAIIQRIFTVTHQALIVHGIRPSSFEKNGWKGLDLNQFMDVYRTGFSDVFIDRLMGKLKVEYHFDDILPLSAIVRAAVMDMPEKIGKRRAYLQENSALENELIREGLKNRLDVLLTHILMTFEEIASAGQTLQHAYLVGTKGLIVESMHDGHFVIEYKDFERESYIQADAQVLSNWLAENWQSITGRELSLIIRFYVEMQGEALRQQQHIFPSIELKDIILFDDRMTSLAEPFAAGTEEEEKLSLIRHLLWFLTGHKFNKIDEGVWDKAREEMATLPWANDPQMVDMLRYLKEFYDDERITVQHIISRLKKLWPIKQVSIDPIIAANVQESFSGIISNILDQEGHDSEAGIESISPDAWAKIAQEIYTQILMQHEGDATLVNDDFHDLLRRYLVPEQLMIYKNRYLLHQDSSKPRALQQADIVTIVEFLHTLSFNTDRLGLRKEMLMVLDLDDIMRITVFSYKFYQSVMQKHGWAGEAWEEIVADPELGLLLKQPYREGTLQDVLESPQKIKATLQHFGILSPAKHYVRMFKEIVGFNTDAVREILGDSGVIDEESMQQFADNFNRQLRDDIIALVSFKGTFIRDTSLHLNINRVVDSVSWTVKADAIYFPRSQTLLGQPVRFRFDELRGARVQELAGNITTIHRMAQERKLPFVKFVNIFDWSIHPRIVLSGPITPKVMEQLGKFTDSFDLLPSGTVGRIKDLDKLKRSIRGHYKEQQRANTIIKAIDTMIKEQVIRHFVTLTNAKEQGNLQELVLADMMKLDSRSRLVWADRYIAMTHAFYQQWFFLTNDDISQLYFDGQHLYVDNPINIVKKNQSSAKNPELKLNVLVAFFKILLGMDIRPLLTNRPDQLWQVIDDAIHHDFHGQNLAVALQMVDMIKTQFERWDWTNFFTSWQGQLAPAVTALAQNQAMVIKQKHRQGGIDFKGDLPVETKEQGGFIHFQTSPAMLAQLQQAKGLTVTINSINTLPSIQDFML